MIPLSGKRNPNHKMRTRRTPRFSSFGLLSFPLSGIIRILLLLFLGVLNLGAAESTSTVIVVVGAPGEPEFGSNFVHQADLWKKACSDAHRREVVIGLDTAAPTNDYELLRQTLASEPTNSPAELWLVLIGKRRASICAVLIFPRRNSLRG